MTSFLCCWWAASWAITSSTCTRACSRIQREQGLGPERLGLCLADVQADERADLGLVRRVGNDQRFLTHAAR
jgi:hypothetical protein